MTNKLSKTSLSALTTAALCIPGLASANGVTPNLDPVSGESTVSNFGDIRAEAKYTHYRESKADVAPGRSPERYSIDVWQGLFVVPYKNYEFSLSLKHDVQSGASGAGYDFGPAGTPPVDSRTEATIYENRNEISLGLVRNGTGIVDRFRLDYSIEADYRAVGGALGRSWSFNKNNTVFSAQAGLSYDQVRPVDDLLFFRPGGDILAQKYYLSLKQDLTKYNFIQASLEFSYDSGMLSNPYRYTTILGDATATGTGQANPNFGFAFPDPNAGFVTLSRGGRPRHRAIWTPMLRFVTKVPYTGGSLHADYRYANSSYGNKSHTFEVAYYQTFAKKLRFTPRFRYYTQSAADFYAPLFDVTGMPGGFPTQPLVGNHFASDPRLSGFGSIAFEGKMTYEIMDNIRFGATGGYYRWSQGLKWGSKDPVAAPGFNASATYGSVELRMKL